MDYAIDNSMELEDFLKLPTVASYLDHPTASLRLVAPDGTYVYASSGVNALLGYTAQEFVQINAWKLTHPDDVSMIKEMGAALANGQAAQCITRAKHKNGEYRWVETRMQPFQDLVGVIVQACEPPADAQGSWEPIEPFL